MKKFENWFILVSVFLCLYSFVAWGEDGQAFSIFMFLGSIVFKSICVSKDDETRKAQELGKAYEKQDKIK